MFRELVPSFVLMSRPSINPDTANAVRYGTAKAEWFLNVVSQIVIQEGGFMDTRVGLRRLSFRLAR